MNLNRFPSVDKRPLDLYKLKKAVETRGGFDKVCKLKKWAEIGRILGYSGKIMSSLSTSLKNSYQKWLHPYEEYLRAAKPGVQQQLEFEYGGPFTPNSVKSPMKRPHQETPPHPRANSPARRASAALNASIKDNVDPPDKPTLAPEPPRTVISSGFTAVNSGGFTPVNLTPASFQVPNVSHPLPSNPATKRETENGPPPLAARPSNDGALSSLDNADHRTPNLAPSNVPNGCMSNPLKRTISHDSINGTSGTDSGIAGGGDDQNGRRSKRLKKGM